MKSYIVALLFAGFGLAAQAQHQLVKKWESEARFNVPESVLFNKTRKVLYVSNIEGKDPWAKDGAGSIGMLGLDGKIIAAEWITGLNAPKGMALYDEKLYVADMDQVVVIDPETGIIISRIQVALAEGLNDVSIDAQGVIYVTDSKAGTLIKIKNGAPAIILEDLKGVNGVLCHDGKLYLLNDGGLYEVQGESLRKIADGMEGHTDGVEAVAGGGFVVSCWQGVVYYVDASGKKELLLDGRKSEVNSADIGYDPATRTVYIPTFWKNSVVAYELK